MLNDECSLTGTNGEIYNVLKSEIIKSYPSNGESIIIEGEEDYVFQITTSENELNTLEGEYSNEYNLSIIDLGKCEDLLKETNGINNDVSLIILKFEKLTSSASKKNVQYEIYDPTTKKKLDTSICENNPIDLYIPITLSDKIKGLYADLQQYGYDLFDANDSFYQDICTPYKSENGTDVLLSDRKKDYYNNNDTTCQANCEYSSYSLESSYLKCECSVVNEEIDTEDMDKFNGEIILTSFYDVLKNSNINVLKCYQLVFDFTKLGKNYGSIIVIIYFLINLVCLFVYIFKGVSPLKVDISNILFQKKKDKNNNINTNNENVNQNDLINNNNNKKSKRKNSQNNKKNRKRRKLHFPPKKKGKINNGFNLRVKNETEDDHLMKIVHKKPKKQNKKKSDLAKKNKNEKHITQKKYEDNNFNKKHFEKISSEAETIEEKNIESKKEEKLDDFELNNLEYVEAIELDKRPFSQVYWAILMREHIILFTFFSCNDYNLFYIKITRFVFLLCTDMAMNAFFFSDDSMHKVYINYGKYDFIQQIPQILYSSIISHVIEIILCYFSLTDKHIYEIKGFANKLKDKETVLKILRCIKLKLFGFFMFTFLLFLFYWYFISAFCAVYQNTQGIFIKDSLSSFATSLVDPFCIYVFTAFLRVIALKDVSKKRFSIIYKISDLIPIF